mmetsp:Transcript_7235/g.17867  ORF Transcript_7235/g.17867 Transcript_7235/m.17867 type:complete len:155 (-) Transcript_7235:155-619(-)
MSMSSAATTSDVYHSYRVAERTSSSPHKTSVALLSATEERNYALEPDPAYFERPRAAAARVLPVDSVSGMVLSRALSESKRRAYNKGSVPLPTPVDYGRTVRLGELGYKTIQDTLPLVKPAGLAVHWSGQTGALKRRFHQVKNTPGGAVKQDTW